MNPIARLPFERAHDAVANVPPIACKSLLPRKHIGRAAVIVVEPVLSPVGMARRVEMRIADRPAKGAVAVLIDVAGTSAPAALGHVVVAAAALVDFPAQVKRDGALAVGERADSAQIDGAGQSHSGHIGVGRFVDDHRAQQLRGILIEFDRSVVPGTGLLASVQQDSREVRRKPAHRNDLRTTGYALRRQAGKPGDRFCDRDIRQLADIFRADCFDNAPFFPFDIDRAAQAGADSGDDDRAFWRPRRGAVPWRSFGLGGVGITGRGTGGRLSILSGGIRGLGKGSRRSRDNQQR